MLEHDEIDEIMEFIELRDIMNYGIGYVDVHILGPALVSNTPLWTLGKSLTKHCK